MKKLIAMLLAGLMLTATMSTMAWADDGAVAGYSFNSVDGLVDYVSGIEEADVSEAQSADGTDGDVVEYLYSADGIYLPGDVSEDDITKITVSPTYIKLVFKQDDTSYSFYHYYSKEAGESVSAEYIEYANKGSYSGQVLSAEDGSDVYYCYVLGYSYFWWIDDGEYFALRFLGNDFDVDDCLSICNAEYYMFDEQSSPIVDCKVSTGKVTLSWEEESDDSCTIYYKRSSSDTWKVAGTTSKQKVNIKGLKSGVSYDLKVEINGVDSEVVTVTAK